MYFTDLLEEYQRLQEGGPANQAFKKPGSRGGYIAKPKAGAFALGAKKPKAKQSGFVVPGGKPGEPVLVDH